jgi:flagellar hook protein FlgE
VKFACNLDKRTPYVGDDASELERKAGTWTSSIKIYDSFGMEHNLEVEFTRVEGTANDWYADVYVDRDRPGETDATVGLGEEAPAAMASNRFIVTFSNNGTLLSAEDQEGNISGGTLPEPALAGFYAPVNQGNISMRVAFNVLTAAPDPEGGVVRQEFTLNLGSIGAYKDSMTQYSEASSTKMVEQDGYTMGYMENFKVDQSGIITGVFSNGTNRVLGQVALASFTNQGGLEKAGDNTFRVSTNSGAANVGPSGIAGKGKIIAGTLEMSNVDMAEQFTDMIVTQRGFQANSRTIQTADQLLQELLTLKR